MQTMKVDNRKRVVLSGAKPGQVFSRQDNSDGSIVLVPVIEVKRTKGPRFPKGSLLKYFTPEKNAEELALVSGCIRIPPDSD